MIIGREFSSEFRMSRPNLKQSSTPTIKSMAHLN